MKGRFITFEGGEGAGKSTLIRSLAATREVLCTREPGGSSFGPEVRKILLEGEDLAPEAELFLFLADRAQHVRQLIKPTLERGMTVLCDRFADSTIVYQGAARAIDPQFVKKACDLAVQGLSPDITFLLDIDPELGLKRTVNRKQDRIEREKLEFHHTIRAAYLQLAKENPERIIVLDASRSPEEIKQEALHALGW